MFDLSPSLASRRSGKLGRVLARLCRERRGLASTEFALLLPFFMTLIFGGYVAYDGFQARDKASMASATVSDMLSRMTTIDNDDFELLEQFYRNIGGANITNVRIDVTAVRYQNDDNGTPNNTNDDQLRHAVKWRYDNSLAKNQRSSPPNVSDPQDEEWIVDDILPLAMAENEMALIVNMSAEFVPIKFMRFTRPNNFTNRLVTFPRFSSSVKNPDAK